MWGRSKNADGTPAVPRLKGGTFSLADLSAIVITLLLLGLVAYAAVSGFRGRGRGAVCVANMARLSLAWQQYATEHHDACVNNFNQDRIAEGIDSKAFGNWVNNVMTWCATDSTKDTSNTNLDWAKSGAFAGYAGRAAKVFKCPEDTALSAAQRNAGWISRLRSVSMNGRLGPVSPRAGSEEPPLTLFSPGAKQILNTVEVIQPSLLVVFIEENPDSIDGGRFLNNTDLMMGMRAVPASYHHGACAVGFADGHAELHQWRGNWVEKYKATTVPNLLYKLYVRGVYDGPSGEDCNWLLERTGATEGTVQ